MSSGAKSEWWPSWAFNYSFCKPFGNIYIVFCGCRSFLLHGLRTPRSQLLGWRSRFLLCIGVHCQSFSDHLFSLILSRCPYYRSRFVPIVTNIDPSTPTISLIVALLMSPNLEMPLLHFQKYIFATFVTGLDPIPQHHTY